MVTSRTIDWSNFHDSTAGSFTRCEAPARTPDYASHSGSLYWAMPEGVIRQSDHWCSGIRSCDWLLHGEECYEAGAAGYISYADLAAGTAERAARWQRAWEESQAKKAAEEALKQPGRKVTCCRQVYERRRGGHYDLVKEVVTFTIAKFTKQFVVTDDGRRFGLSTIKSWELA